jgi:hypothetical protein
MDFLKRKRDGMIELEVVDENGESKKMVSYRGGNVEVTLLGINVKVSSDYAPLWVVENEAIGILMKMFDVANYQLPTCYKGFHTNLTSTFSSPKVEDVAYG